MDTTIGPNHGETSQLHIFLFQYPFLILFCPIYLGLTSITSLQMFFQTQGCIVIYVHTGAVIPIHII
jgi:hypothetical protein